MSRWYRMEFQVIGFDKKNEEDIVNFIDSIWDVDHLNPYEALDVEKTIDDINKKNNLNLPYTSFILEGENALYGGESEEEFSKRIGIGIWERNKGYCPVTIIATYLEDIPYEQHYLDYNAYLESKKCEKDKMI